MAPEDHGFLTLTPIGVVRSPFVERSAAPRQSALGAEARGRIELFPGHGFEHALDDIDEWSHLWVLFWFHKNSSWRPKVQPPRGDRKRGVFATRSPYRPNPLGLSAVKLETRNGLVLEVSGLDILDGTPVLDIKPYVEYTDAITDAEHGWLKAPEMAVSCTVSFDPLATQQLAFLGERGAALRAALCQTLALGSGPQPYRRIKADGDAFLIAVKDWRARFRQDANGVTVFEIHSGYRPSQLQGGDPALQLHRDFQARFTGAAGSPTAR